MRAVSLFLDEDVRVLLAEVLRNRGYEATHVLEAGRCGKSDEEQLAYASKNKMAILTHNVKDFTILSKAYEAQGKKLYGIIVSGQLPFNELLKRVLRLLSSHPGDAFTNKIIWLSDFKSV
jgi:predicted nuclease of predicted toxin-antitoxin system